MSRRILVLGANGYIGSRVVEALAGCGWAVPVAASRQGSGGSGIEAVRLDATDSAALSRAMVGVDGVVNCVAADATIMVAAARTLLAAAGSAGPMIVHFSSMAVYGSQTGVVDETASLRDDLDSYASAKIAIERMMASYPHAIVLRPGCVYGPGSPQSSIRIARLLQAHRLGDLGAAGEGVANLVHIDNVIAAVLAALERPQAQGRIYNLAMHDAPDWNAYFFRFAKALGAVPIRRIGDMALKVETRIVAPLLKLGQIMSKKTGMSMELPPFISPSLLRLFRQDITLVSSRAEHDLGVAWADLDRSLAAIASAFTHHRP